MIAATLLKLSESDYVPPEYILTDKMSKDYFTPENTLELRRADDLLTVFKSELPTQHPMLASWVHMSKDDSIFNYASAQTQNSQDSLAVSPKARPRAFSCCE